MNHETQTKITPQEQERLEAWILEAQEIIELIDVLIFDAENCGRKTQVEKLWEIRKAVKVIDECIGVVADDGP